MPVPKRKVSRSRRDKRSANKGLKPKVFSHCINCKEPIAPHQACKQCGFYKGKQVIAGKANRTAKRAQQKQEKAAKERGPVDAKIEEPKE